LLAFAQSAAWTVASHRRFKELVLSRRGVDGAVVMLDPLIPSAEVRAPSYDLRFQRAILPAPGGHVY
jgi:hypothetical protein